MRGTGRMVGLLALAGIVATAGCESISGPDVPSVEGTWTGDFRGSSVRMELTQSGDAVSGSMDVGSRTYTVSGTMSMTGTFAWSTDIWQSDCSSYGTSGLQLESAGTEMTGVARRGSSAPPCGSSTRVLVAQGTMALTRAF